MNADVTHDMIIVGIAGRIFHLEYRYNWNNKEGSMDRLTWIASDFFRCLAIICLARLTSSGSSEIREYCNMETFFANCSGSGGGGAAPLAADSSGSRGGSVISDQVVLMQSAFYGQMRLGRCIETDYSKRLGCFVDVLTVVDDLCSAKKHCHFKLPEDKIYHRHTCPKEITSYLEASYTCVPVEKVISARCEFGIPIRTTSGYITNSNQQPQRCKWNLTVPLGQRINLTLFDFGQVHWQQRSASSHGGKESECLKYADVREGAALKTSVICSSSNRVKAAYLSETSSVEIVTYSDFGGDLAEHQRVRFLLKFEAVGCTDPVHGSQHASSLIVSRDGDKAVISCNGSSDVKHYLVCQAGQWVGNLPSCAGQTSSGGHSWGLQNLLFDSWSNSQGLLAVIVLGIALGVVLGVVMLAPVLVYFKRRDIRNRNMSELTKDYYMDSTLGHFVSGVPPDPNKAITSETEVVPELTYNWCNTGTGASQTCALPHSQVGAIPACCLTTPHHMTPSAERWKIKTYQQQSQPPSRQFPVDKINTRYLVQDRVEMLEHDYDLPK